MNTTPDSLPRAHAHKLFAPPVYSGAIRRETLLDRVFANPSVRVILLQGPAGHGKSTTLQQIKSACEAQQWLTAWLTFDDADNDARRFAIHVQALVDHLCGNDVERRAIREAIIDVPRSRRADLLLDRLSQLQRPVAVFLDEFQTLRNKSCLTFFRDLFEHVPQNVRIFIGSRSLPEVGLAKLLVNQVAIVFRADDLRFSPQEVSQFFASAGELQVSATEVESIYRRTEGWPAALQLYRLALSSPEVRASLGDLHSSSPRELAEYLADNVLALQSPRIRTFLLRTSLLTRLTAPLCDLVTGRRDSQQLLLEIERSGLFVRSMDAQCQWFRYHGLFSTILAETFERMAPAQAMEVHARAAHWHLDQRQYEDAMHHAVACRDFNLAADTLDVWAGQLVPTAYLATVERWSDRLPIEHVFTRRSLAIKVAYALMFLRRSEKLRPVLNVLRSVANTTDSADPASPLLVLAMSRVLEDDVAGAFETGRCIVDNAAATNVPGEGFREFELGAASNVVAYRELAVGDFEAARKALTQAELRGRRGQATFSAGYTSALYGVRQLLLGNLRGALDLFRQELAAPEARLERSFASAAQASCHIWALYESGDLDAAESLAEQFQEDIFGSAIPDFTAVMLIALVRIHDVRGRAARALDALEELERMGHQCGWTSLVIIADWERVRRALVAGDLERARMIAEHVAVADRVRPLEWIAVCDDFGGGSLGRIRLAIHEGELDAAATALAAEWPRQPHRTYRNIKLSLLEALLHSAMGNAHAALGSLRKAVQWAQPGGFVRCFLDEGDGIVRLLRKEYQRIMERGAAERAFVEQVLSASGTDLTQLAPAPRLTEPLSKREIQMLSMLANGVSNREIAARLFISENTVKYHLKNIYAKLTVTSRTQAINVARQLQIVG